MKKAVIISGGKQYLVAEGDEITTERIKSDKKDLSFEPLLVINGEKVAVGKPTLSESKVTAEIVSQDVLAPKVMAIRYKAKKRVHKLRGHRQIHTILKINTIS